MKKSILLLLLMCCLVQLSEAQQLPIFSQYQEGDHFTNPALLSQGIPKYDLTSTASLTYRNQWTQVKDAPRTALGRFDHFDEDYNLSYGGTLIFDQTGPTSFLGIYGKVGYGIEFDRDWMLSVALSGGITQYRVEAGDLNFLEQGDIAQNNQSIIFPDLGLGAVLYYKKQYYFGFSIPQVLGLGTSFTNNGNDFNIQRVRHYYATTGGVFQVRNDDWIEVNVYGKYVPHAPFLAGANFRYDYNDTFWIGMGGSSAGAVSVEGGLIIGGGSGYWTPLRVGYGLTNYFSEFNLNFGFVHELKAAYFW